MKCISDEVIQQYIDGETQPQETSVVEKHIETCRECAARVSHQRALKAKLLEAINLLASPAAVSPELRSSTKPSKGKRVLLSRVVPLLAAASILLFVGLFFQKDKTIDENVSLTEASFAGEMDANRPVIQQELTITVISPKGGISEHIID